MSSKVLDENKDNTSSVSSEAASRESQDVNNNEQQSSTAKDGKQETVEDVVAAVLDKHKAGATDKPEAEKSSDSEEGKSKESGVLKENKTSNDKKEGEVKEETKLSKSDEQLPFGKHPRFKELVEQKNLSERKVQELEPYAARAKAIDQFLTTNKITPQDYEAALQLTALVQADPAKALTALESITEQIRLNLGQALPKDLQQRVDEGTLAASDAKEMAQLRLSQRRNETQVKQTQEQASRQTQQQIVSSLDSWSQSTAKSDPDFKPKTAASEPDGKYELVYAKFTSLWQQSQPKDAQAAIALAQKAYEDVNNYDARFKPAPIKRNVASTNSSRKQVDDRIDTSKPGWARKVAHNVLANRA